MIRIVGVRFKKAGKIYYFSPESFEIQKNDFVIVETARGVEYGQVVVGIREIEESELVSPLKPVLRIATEDDAEVHRKNKEDAKGKQKSRNSVDNRYHISHFECFLIISFI